MREFRRVNVVLKRNKTLIARYPSERIYKYYSDAQCDDVRALVESF